MTSEFSTQRVTTSNQARARVSTYPFGKCKVCGDKATGIHYGVATCEGCKGFFKRSTQRTDMHHCSYGNLCSVTSKNRNRCKACRFRKCILVGMSLDGVKMGRIPKAEKERAIAEADEQDAHQDTQLNLHRDFLLNLIQNSFVNIYGFAAAKSFAYDLATDTKFFSTDSSSDQKLIFKEFLIKSTTEVFSHHFEKINRILMQASTRSSKFSAQHMHESFLKLKTIQAYKECVIKTIVQLKKIAGIADLSSRDFIVLTKTHALSIFMILHSKLLVNNESFLILDKQTYLTRSHMLHLFGENVVNALFEFSKTFNALNLLLNEISVLIPLILTCPCTSIVNHGILHHIHESFTQAMNHVLSTNKRDQVFVDNLNRIILLFPRLSEIIPFIFEQLIF